MKLAHTLLVLGLLLCVADTTAQEPDTTAQKPDTTAQELAAFQVVISKTTVTLICPVSTPYSIYQKEEFKTQENEYTILEYKSSQHDGEYRCVSKERNITLSLKAKVCESCVELDPLTVAGIIIADLLITLGVLVLAYYFSKNRKGHGSGSGGGRAGGHPRGQKMMRPPPVPNPDYEPIRKGQREVYAGLDSRGF